ncbi:MAG: hypothetical protein J5634_02040 [Bacilli bacterium]|nr:hypothetical protein [Bacilli bacterium]
MAQKTIHDALRSKCNISASYDERIDLGIEKLYYTAGLSPKNIEDSADIINVICADSMFKNDGDLCVFSMSVPELSELEEKIKEFDSVVAFPNLRSVIIPNVLEKAKYCEQNGYPYLDANNCFIPELFNANINPENYLYSYYVSNDLYTLNEDKNASYFRNCSMDLYNGFVSFLQKLSYSCFGKVLKLSDEFNKFVVYKLSEEGNMVDYDTLLSESLELIKINNDFFDNSIYEYVYNDPEADRGVRR